MANNRELLSILPQFQALAKAIGVPEPTEDDGALAIIAKCLQAVATAMAIEHKQARSLDTIGKAPRVPRK